MFWSGQLAINRLSDNVGGVKHFSRTLQRALGEERHFALVDGFAFSNPGSLVISQVGNSVRPMHFFGRQRPIMITTSNSSGKRSGTPNTDTGEFQEKRLTQYQALSWRPFALCATSAFRLTTVRLQ